MDFTQLNKYSLVLLQEFWDLDTIEAESVIEHCRENISKKLKLININLRSGKFIEELKSYIKTDLLPPSHNVAVLNQGEINALVFAGKRLNIHLDQNATEHTPATTYSNEYNFISALLLLQNSDNSLISTPASETTVDKPDIPYQQEPAINIQEKPAISVSNILKWFLFGFALLFLLSFLLLKLFS